MKLVQVGILLALIAVGVLLFMVYRGQQQAAAVPAGQESLPAEVNPGEPPPPEPAPAPEVAVSKPSPVRSGRQASKASSLSPPARPEPVAAPPAPPAVSETAVSAPAPPPAAAPEPSAVRAEPPPPPPPPQPRTVTVEAGTLLSVRLAESLTTEKVQTGDTFTGTLDRPLVVDGLVVAERGARVEGRVEEAVQAGRVRGVASLSIRLVRLLTANGQRLEIRTDPFQKEGETTKGQDAAKVGGGAGIGAAVGAIAGGGKGAAIGAAIGGAAGAGTVAATRGKPAVLPVETRIDFRLSQSFTVTEKK